VQYRTGVSGVATGIAVSPGDAVESGMVFVSYQSSNAFGEVNGEQGKAGNWTGFSGVYLGYVSTFVSSDFSATNGEERSMSPWQTFILPFNKVSGGISISQVKGEWQLFVVDGATAKEEEAAAAEIIDSTTKNTTLSPVALARVYFGVHKEEDQGDTWFESKRYQVKEKKEEKKPKPLATAALSPRAQLMASQRTGTFDKDKNATVYDDFSGSPPKGPTVAAFLLDRNRASLFITPLFVTPTSWRNDRHGIPIPKTAVILSGEVFGLVGDAATSMCREVCPPRLLISLV
jgi:hypothetical protein